MKLIEIAFFTENVKGMVEFYQVLLNSDPVARSNDMAIFVTGETKIFIHRKYQAADGDLPPINHTAYKVEDVDATCKSLMEQGLKLEYPPKDYYWGRSAYLRDPDGQLIEITG